MIFSTFQFLVFFVVVLLLYFVLPKSWRHGLLLISSYYFYMCSVPWYITVIIAITLIDFWAGIKIDDALLQSTKRRYLILSIISNFGLLFTLKYAGFFSQSFGFNVPLLRFILPLGISFHTFQAVSYTVEVYRGRYPAERNLLTYALYVAFFPQMVAGPIERPYNLLPQFHTGKALTYDRFQSGVRLTLWGLFKKVAVADLLAPAVGTVYSHPRNFSGPLLGLATVFFAIQIYCDFSGYTDMAIGIARMMGLRLDDQFSAALFFQINRRVLAALAYFALQLVSRLPVHPSWRQPRAETSLLFQPDGSVPGIGTLAWCQLDVCRLGSAAWLLLDLRPGDSSASRLA